MNVFGQLVFHYILLMVAISAVSKVETAEFIYGGEARRVCKAYKRVCSDGKVCALQTIDWPQTMKFPVCVYRHNRKVKHSVCKKAPQPGRCAARFTRWYYNIHMRACSWFTYSGCGGNNNNFRTFEECTRMCTSNGDVNTTIIKDGRKDQNDFDNDGGEETIKRRVPASAPAPESIDLIKDVTSTLSLERGPIRNDQDDSGKKYKVVRTQDGNEGLVLFEEEEDKIVSNLARKLQKQERRRKRKLERERRRREKLLRKREREMIRKKKREERLARKKSLLIDVKNDLGTEHVVVDIDDTNGLKESLSPQEQRKFFDEERRKKDRERNKNTGGNHRRQNHTRSSGRNDRVKGGKSNQGRQLTKLELGPYYESGLSLLSGVGGTDSSSSSTEPFSTLGKYNSQRWLIDDKFGLSDKEKRGVSGSWIKRSSRKGLKMRRMRRRKRRLLERRRWMGSW